MYAARGGWVRNTPLYPYNVPEVLLHTYRSRGTVSGITVPRGVSHPGQLLHFVLRRIIYLSFKLSVRYKVFARKLSHLPRLTLCLRSLLLHTRSPDISDVYHLGEINSELFDAHPSIKFVIM